MHQIISLLKKSVVAPAAPPQPVSAARSPPLVRLAAAAAVNRDYNDLDEAGGSPAPPSDDEGDDHSSPSASPPQSESDSDSAVEQSNRKARKTRGKRVQTKKPTTAAAAKRVKSEKAKERDALRGEIPLQLQPTRVSLAQALQPRMDVVERKTQMPHILGARTMSSALAQEITRLHGDEVWQRRVTASNALFQQELLEYGTVLTRDGLEFRNPDGFDAIKIFLDSLPRNNVPLASLQREMTYLYRIPPCYPEYNAKYLHQVRPGADALPCINGEKGKCITQLWFGFVMQEFETPPQAADRLRSRVGVADSARKAAMCLLCDRECSARLQAEALVTDSLQPQDYVYQTHRNPVNIVGAYLLDDCLVIGGGIIYPILENCRNSYRYHESNGHKWLTEDGYLRCTDADVQRQNF